MRIRRTSGALLATTAALLLATASPAMAKGGTGGGGGGGGTTVPAAGCAHIVSAIVDPHPAPINPNPVYPEPIVTQSSTPTEGQVAFDVTVNNQCLDEGGGPRSSLSVAVSTYDTATAALLNTGVNMQPAGAIITWRSWSNVPTAIDPTWANFTKVISLTKANGQVQDTLTYTVAQMQQDIMTAAATGTPVSLR